MVFYVYSGLCGEGPEEITEVAINEHCSDHAGDGKVGAFCDTILRWGARDSFFKQDTVGFTVFFHFPTSELGGVVNLKDGESLPCEVFCGSLELDEEVACLITGFHEKEGNETGVTIYKHDVIRVISVAVWEWASDVTVNTLKCPGRAAIGVGRERCTFYVCSGTNGTRFVC